MYIFCTVELFFLGNLIISKKLQLKWSSNPFYHFWNLAQVLSLFSHQIQSVKCSIVQQYLRC